jgi:hypothetical protein
MKYDLEIDERVIDKFTEEWRLPDPVLDELERLFDEELASDPVSHLRKPGERRKGSEYHCRVVGQGVRRLVYEFIFRVHYKAGHNALIVYDAFLKPLSLAGFD